MQEAAKSISHLDMVALESRNLLDSLTKLNLQAESSVKHVRALDKRRAAMQLVLDRVEDLLDLRSCLTGLQDSTSSGDLESMAMQLKRFKAIEKVLEVPESDVDSVRRAESSLLQRVISDFERALEEQKHLQSQAMASDTDPAAAAALDAQSHRVAAEINKCCQLMSLLGRSDLGLSLYSSYLSTALSSDCASDLRHAVATGVDSKLTALNVVSSIFGRAAAALGSAESLAASTFAAEQGTACVLTTIHGVAEKHAARVVLSFARCARLHAALVAREVLLSTADNPAAMKAQSASWMDDQAAQHEHGDDTRGISAAKVSRYLAALEDDRNDAPFGALPADSTTTSTINGADLSSPMVYDTFLDETALILQRCASYWRLVLGRAGEADAGAGRSSASEAAAVVTPREVEAAVRSAHKLLDAVAELGSKYSALEGAYVLSGIGKALALEEVMEQGAQGASVNLMDPSLPVGPPLPGHPAASPRPGSSDQQGNSHSLGGGALVSTAVEDAFFVFQKAARRAFAAGNADAAASVVNAIVIALQERLSAELETRFKLALADQAELQKAAAAMTPTQADRANAMRAALMSSLPVKTASSYIAEYQTMGLPASAGGRPGGDRGAGAGSNAPDPGFATPGKSGASSGAGGAAGGRRGNLADGASGGGSSTPGVGDGGGGSSSASVRGTAKLTEEIAAACLALNNLQLAAECSLRLQSFLQDEAAATFQDVKEAAKVRTSLASLADCTASFRRSLDNSISTLVSRLTPRLRSAMNVFEGASSLIQYEMSESAFDASSGEGVNAFTTEFLPVLASILAPYQFALTPSLAVAVVTKVASYLSKQLEPRIKRKRFNQLGGLQFDGDMRALLAFFVCRASRRVRDKFVRLMQMGQVLNLETPDEIMEYWTPSAGSTSIASSSSASGAGGGVSAGMGMVWELSADEVKATLGLRVDFSPADIQNLSL